eukprot:CAMPEP_0174262636 /NCGR_PEP_ID=MMETSP0439-20130205/14150_1 /TAXON_ID=0 /ORGANISM="Stereomyxa ramosa, Strain Chinc5" /LENGTH=112 /DNA_ID=CAMNT_0015347449 /DNA_START=44 /DNA_END=382 /DNA_ORIENTATION=+
MLQSNVKGVTQGFPLGLEVTETEVTEHEFNPEFIQKMIPKLDWHALVTTAKVLEITLPEEIPDEQDEEFLRNLKVALLDVEVKEGTLICPESGRRFPIINGIPNMLLTEDEV